MSVSPWVLALALAVLHPLSVSPIFLSALARFFAIGRYFRCGFDWSIFYLCVFLWFSLPKNIHQSVWAAALRHWQIFWRWFSGPRRRGPFVLFGSALLTRIARPRAGGGRTLALLRRAQQPPPFMEVECPSSSFPFLCGGRKCAPTGARGGGGAERRVIL